MNIPSATQSNHSLICSLFIYYLVKKVLFCPLPKIVWVYFILSLSLYVKGYSLKFKIWRRESLAIAKRCMNPVPKSDIRFVDILIINFIEYFVVFLFCIMFFVFFFFFFFCYCCCRLSFVVCRLFCCNSLTSLLRKKNII